MNLLATRLITVVAAIFAACPTALSEGLRERVDSLRRAYDFPGAVDACINALKYATEDGEIADINELLTVCRAGRTMMSNCISPKVVAKARFASEEFIYYYPVGAKDLIFNPSGMDADGGDVYSKAILAPSRSDVLFYSRKTPSGSRDLCCALREGNGWSSPMNLPEVLSSDRDEIYPFMSSDGKSLYFSSQGHGSIGGFDLYVSHRNASGEWSAPENLGFPFSSPFNDFLLYNTPDGKYTVFASDRACPGSDSLYLYVLEYEKVPSRTIVDSVEDLRMLESLNLPSEQAAMDISSAMGNDVRESSETVRYEQKMEQVRDLRISITTMEKELEVLRSRYYDERTADLRRLIEEKESALPPARALLDKATKELRTIEMDFLTAGVVLDMDKAKADSKKDIVGAGTGYTFTRMDL